MKDPKKSLRQVNLNLLPTLHALLSYRNVTKAAGAIFLSQSAVSTSLKKLREIFEDELLVVEGREMLLTPLARNLIEPLNEAMQSLQLLFDRENFVPAQSDRHFRVVTADYVTSLILPGVLQRLSAEAPDITVEFAPVRRKSFELLRRGELELIISVKRLVNPHLIAGTSRQAPLCCQKLFMDRLVCIVAASDESIDTEISLDDYKSRYHAVFSAAPGLHASLEHIALAEQNISQNNRVVVPEFWQLPLLVSRSDCVALVPESLALFAARNFPVKIVESPLVTPPLELIVIWTQGDDQDDGHKWFRSIVLDAAVRSPYGDAVAI